MLVHADERETRKSLRIAHDASRIDALPSPTVHDTFTQDVHTHHADVADTDEFAGNACEVQCGIQGVAAEGLAQGTKGLAIELY